VRPLQHLSLPLQSLDSSQCAGAPVFMHLCSADLGMQCEVDSSSQQSSSSCTSRRHTPCLPLGQGGSSGKCARSVAKSCGFFRRRGRARPFVGQRAELRQARGGGRQRPRARRRGRRAPFLSRFSRQATSRTSPRALRMARPISSPDGRRGRRQVSTPPSCDFLVVHRRAKKIKTSGNQRLSLLASPDFGKNQTVMRLMHLFAGLITLSRRVPAPRDRRSVRVALAAKTARGARQARVVAIRRRPRRRARKDLQDRERPAQVRRARRQQDRRADRERLRRQASIATRSQHVCGAMCADNTIATGCFGSASCSPCPLLQRTEWRFARRPASAT